LPVECENLRWLLRSSARRPATNSTERFEESDRAPSRWFSVPPTARHGQPVPRAQANPPELCTNREFQYALPAENSSTAVQRNTRKHREEHRALRCRVPLRRIRRGED